MVKINIAGIAESVLNVAKSTFEFFKSLFVEKIPKQAWGVLGLGIAATCAGIYFNRQWVEASPNEWLLIIRHGKLVEAGIGLKRIALPQDTIVRFPSKV